MAAVYRSIDENPQTFVIRVYRSAVLLSCSPFELFLLSPPVIKAKAVFILEYSVNVVILYEVISF